MVLKNTFPIFYIFWVLLRDFHASASNQTYGDAICHDGRMYKIIYDVWEKNVETIDGCDDDSNIDCLKGWVIQKDLNYLNINPDF